MSEVSKRPLTDDEVWIISHNLPLVDFCMRGRPRDDATWNDMRSAGYLGLCRAIKTFDPEFSAWSTYATQWIRRYIQIERQGDRLVHVPFYHLFGRKDSDHVVSRKNQGLKAELTMQAKSLSLDCAEAVKTLMVMPPDEQDERRIDIEQCLNGLNMQQRVVISRLVMGGEKIVEVARDLGVTRQRVARVKSCALRQMYMQLKWLKKAGAI